MLCDALLEHMADTFRRTTSTWAQLHTGDPGPDGHMAGCIDGRRVEIRWSPVPGTSLVAENALHWREVQGIPGFPQTVTHLSLWSDPDGGRCWAVVPLAPIRVPHLATLEIPIGLTVSLAPERTDL